MWCLDVSLSFLCVLYCVERTEMQYTHHHMQFFNAACTLRDDTIAPTVHCPPTQNITLNNTCEATVPNLLFNATDNCPISQLVTNQSIANGTTLIGVHTTSITIDATDRAGNTGSCVAELNLIDTTKPTQILNTTVADANGTCQALVNMTTSATDNCTPQNQLKVSQNATLVTGLGLHIIQVSASDAHGNTATFDVSFSLIDKILPTLNINSVVANASSTCHGTIPSLASYAADNCAVATVVQTPTNKKPTKKNHYSDSTHTTLCSISLFIYTPMSNTVLSFLNCVQVNQENVEKTRYLK